MLDGKGTAITLQVVITVLYCTAQYLYKPFILFDFQVAKWYIGQYLKNSLSLDDWSDLKAILQQYGYDESFKVLNEKQFAIC